MASPNGGYIRMVVSYWEMAGSLVVNGAIDQKMFNEANGEHLVVFGKVEHLIPKWREMMGNPNLWKNLETVALWGPRCPQKYRLNQGENQGHAGGPRSRCCQSPKRQSEQ